MALAPGVRLGPYEIVGALGAGGMGEVYRARDTRLDRTVAIKVLAPALADDAGLRERFDREARAISSLNHPHICALFDIGDAPEPLAGGEGGATVRFLVLEYLEGQTLAHKLAAGPLPVGDAVTYAAQIADALDKAHRAGIVHRDLKPANVMITKAGAKLLDFGLAKSAAPVIATSGLSMLPTTPPGLTAQGTILGTFQYMAPEQIEGLEADARTDIFAFGALLLEMLTGRTAFEGKTRASLLGSILKDPPPRASSLASGVPRQVDRVIETCLAKDPDDRYQTARDLLRDLRWAASPEAVTVGAAASTRPPSSSRVAWVVAAVATVGFVAASLVAVRHLREVPPTSLPVQFSIAAPDQHTFGGPRSPGTGVATQLAVSPDGRHVAFVADKDNVFRVWLRSLDAAEARPLAGSEGGAFPFWSPDSRSIAFFADGKLKRAQLTGTPPVTVCDAASGRGGTWNPEGTIVFAPANVGPLLRVASAGGVPTPVSTLDTAYGDTNHRFPNFLPDGRYFLYTAVTGAAGGAPRPAVIRIGSLDSHDAITLMPVESAAVFASDHLLFNREGVLMAQPFDAAARKPRGEPIPIAHEIGSEGSRYASFSASPTGTLVYARGGGLGQQLTWIDRAGTKVGTLGDAAFFSSVVLSPDETRIAVTRSTRVSANRDVWTIDVARGNVSRVTFDPGDEAFPVWSPDGSRLAFQSLRAGEWALRTATPGSTSADELLFKAATPVQRVPADWSSDGRYILYIEGAPPTSDIWVLPTFGDRKPFALVATPFAEDSATFSPDGRWVAYTSNESGPPQVYVQPFPATGRKFLVSRDGGSQPLWRADGRELFFRGEDAGVYAVAVTTAPLFDAGPPTQLFFTPSVTFFGGRRQYAVTRDGKRFLFMASQTASTTPLTVVTDWMSLVRR